MHASRLSVLIEELEQQHKSIEGYAFCSDSRQYDEALDRQDFFGTIATFVEFVLSTEELRDVFEALLSTGTSDIPARRHIGSNAAQLMQSIYYYATAEDNESRKIHSKKIWYLSNAQGRPGKRVARDVYLRLRSALTNRIARQTVINRFKAYCELYKTAWLIDELSKVENERQPETFLQDFLEEYVFQQGYYPISEAQLGRGRLDILVHRPDEASFLVEAKQVGFGSEGAGATIVKKAVDKIEQAIAQALTYRHRLAGYTRESDVYIVLFTLQYFVFEDEQPVKRGGLSFFVEVVNLIDKPVTQWGTPEGLSLEEAQGKRQSKHLGFEPTRKLRRIMSDFSSEVQGLIALALAEAQHYRSPVLGTPHLFIALTKLDGVAAAALRAWSHEPKRVRDGLRSALGHGDAPPGTEPQLTARAAANLRQAEALAAEEEAARVEERHLLAAILDDDETSFTLRTLRALGVDVETLRAGLTSATPILDRVGRDLTAQARTGGLVDPLIGRKQELHCALCPSSPAPPPVSSAAAASASNVSACVSWRVACASCSAACRAASCCSSVSRLISCSHRLAAPSRAIVESSRVRRRSSSKVRSSIALPRTAWLTRCEGVTSSTALSRGDPLYSPSSASWNRRRAGGYSSAAGSTVCRAISTAARLSASWRSKTSSRSTACWVRR